MDFSKSIRIEQVFKLSNSLFVILNVNVKKFSTLNEQKEDDPGF